MGSPDHEGMEPFVVRYGPIGGIHQRRRRRSTDLIDIFANLHVGSPATDDYFMQKRKLYKYTPIPSSGYIRLLYLRPVTANVSELRGFLRPHKLNKHSVYEAISYAWGEFPSLNRVINLDGKVLKITDNLFAALMAYSRPDRTRVLWVDAICINQEDTHEKSQQVALMADIYSRASMVQVWLTLPSQWTMDAIKFLKHLSTKAETYGISKDVGHPRATESWPTVNSSMQEAEELLEDAVNHHVDFLLCRLYWNRVWVVQEVALATDLIVSCGHTTIRWIDMARALEVLRGAYREIPRGKTWLKMEGIKVAWSLVQHRDMFRMLDQYAGFNHHQATNQAARQMSNRACSDDRDRVYAMLAMTRSPMEMVPDYTKTVAEAYTEFTRRYSPNTQIYFAGLARRQPEPRSNTVSNGQTQCNDEDDEGLSIDIMGRDYLPSWVPEFRPEKNLAWAPSFNGTYATASSTPFFFLPHPTINNIMFATGAILDTIETTSPNYNMKAPNCLYNPAFFFPLVTLLTNLLENPPSSSLTSPDPFPIQLAKTLTAGAIDCPGAASVLARYPHIKSLSHLASGSLPWLTTIWTAFATHCLSPTGTVYQYILVRALSRTTTRFPNFEHVPQDVGVAWAFLNYLANVLIPEKLFTTRGGGIGLAPGMMRKGDALAVVNGCHTPYVVREVRRVRCGEERIEGAVRIVGPCYWHGVMRGELVSERGEEKWKELKWTRVEGNETEGLEGWLTFV